MGSLSIWHWLVLLLIIVLVFGTKKLGNVGSDLGKAIRDFKKGLNGEDADDASGGEAKLKADPPASAESATSATRDKADQDAGR